MKEVFSISFVAIIIILYLENPSMKDNIECLVVLSTNILMCVCVCVCVRGGGGGGGGWVGWGESFLSLALFRSQKCTQTHKL